MADLLELLVSLKDHLTYFFSWIFFLNALHRGSKKITYVLCTTIIISSYVIQHRNPAWILAQQINQRSLWARWAKERSSDAKTVANSEIPLSLPLQSGTWLPVWGWWECPTLFWWHSKIKVKRFTSFSFLASRKEIQVCEPGYITCCSPSTGGDKDCRKHHTPAAQVCTCY